MKLRLKGRGLIPGIGEGEALVTEQWFGFRVNPATGLITDKRHEWIGKNMRGRVLVYPFGKSSSSGGLWIMETVRCGNAPAAIINVETEPIIGIGCLLAGVLYHQPVVLVDRTDKNPCRMIKTGDYVRVNGKSGVVEILKRA